VRILIVDDEISILEGFKWILEKKEHQVITARDYETAKKYIIEKDFDLYFISCKIIGGNGLELIKLKNKLGKKGILIIMSCYHYNQIKKDLENLKYTHFLQKPANKKAILEIIEKNKKNDI